MMLRERINKIFANKAFYIVFSVLASLTIWLYVSYIENPDVPWTVRGIKVEMLNQDYVTDRGLVITGISTDTVSLKFSGKRNIVTQLNNSNVAATVDLAEIKTTGVFQLEYKPVYPIDVNPASFTTTKNVDFIAVTVDNLSKKEVPVRGTYDGGVAEGYQGGTLELSPTNITVSGPETVLNKISYAWVSVYRENISKTVEEELPFTLMDETGHEVISDKISFSQNTVRVVIQVNKIKEIPLTVNLIPAAGADSTNSVYTVSPASISVSGDADTLNELNQIQLGSIDLSKFLSTTTIELPIILPNNTTSLTGITSATVTVNINGLDSKHLNADNIQVINVTAGYTVSILTKNLDITLRGKVEELDKITESNIRVVADLSDLGATTGTYGVLAKVYVDGDIPSVGPIGEYKVTVTLTKD